MESQKILYSEGKNDDMYTPVCAVKPILPYLEKKAFLRKAQCRLPKLTIWCPFDTEKSEFVKQISQLKDIKVVFSHIANGQDFYKYEPDYWDIIVSNPPFTNKRKIFERALSFNKPFALIMSNTWLNDSAPKQLFKDKELQLLMFEERIKFIKPDGVVENKITFSSSYYCYNFLPKQIVMGTLNN